MYQAERDVGKAVPLFPSVDEQDDACFGRRLGASFIDIVVILGLEAVGSFGAWFVLTPLTGYPADPDAWLSPQAAYALVAFTFCTPIAYIAASWSPLFGRRSVGKRLFHLRVVRDDR